MTNDKQKEWRDIFRSIFGSGSKDFLEQCGYQPRYSVGRDNAWYILEKNLESFIEDLLDKTRKEVAEEIVELIKSEYAVGGCNDVCATNEGCFNCLGGANLVDDIKDKYLKD